MFNNNLKGRGKKTNALTLILTVNMANRFEGSCLVDG